MIEVLKYSIEVYFEQTIIIPLIFQVILMYLLVFTLIISQNAGTRRDASAVGQLLSEHAASAAPRRPEAEHYMSLPAQQPSAVLLGGGGELPHLV